MNWILKVLIESICFALLCDLCYFYVSTLFSKYFVVQNIFGSWLRLTLSLLLLAAAWIYVQIFLIWRNRKIHYRLISFLWVFAFVFFLSSFGVQTNCLQAATFLFSRRLFFSFPFFFICYWLTMCFWISHWAAWGQFLLSSITLDGLGTLFALSVVAGFLLISDLPLKTLMGNEIIHYFHHLCKHHHRLYKQLGFSLPLVEQIPQA